MDGIGLPRMRLLFGQLPALLLLQSLLLFMSLPLLVLLDSLLLLLL